MNLVNIFSYIGLSNEYALIYSCLLENGLLRIMEISKQTNLPRTSCYEYLPTLKEKDLIEEKLIGKSRYYKAKSPKNLLKLLYKKKNDFNFVLNSLENDFSKLDKLYKIQQAEFKFDSFKGHKELTNLFKRLMNFDRLCGIGSIEYLDKLNSTITKSIKKIIKSCSNFINTKDLLKEEFTKPRNYEENIFKFIGNQKLIIIDLKDNSAIEIKNKRMYVFEKFLYENLNKFLQ